MFYIFKKTLILPILLISLFFANSVSAAANVTVMDGLIFAGAPYWGADGEGNDRYTVDFDTQEVTKIKLQSWSAGYGEMLIERVVESSTFGAAYFTGSNFTCNAYYRAYYYNGSGSQVGYIELNIHDLLQPSCDSGGNNGVETPPTTESGCIGCDLFNCPGWTDYMGKLDEIKAAIPPPPNWSAVADTFRDSIAPRIKSDMADLIGTTTTPSAPSFANVPSKPTAPGQPTAPTQPTKPAMLPGVNDGGIQKPTGNEAPGLDGSTFTGEDLKSAAPTITERTDPTGGFNLIGNPVEGLPSQDDFIKNAPIEEPFYFPSNPTGEETVDPSDTPTEPTFTEPTFTDPSIDYDTTPIPGGGTAAPTDPTEPIITEPTGDYDTAPIPGSDSGTAPSPGEGATYGAPYP